jgi:hypothetical protein
MRSIEIRLGAVALCLPLLCAAVASAELPVQDWVRTETRDDCTSYNPLRSPFFGETHIHTSFSGDAAFVRVRTTPSDAYDFAKGAQIGLPPYDAFDDPTRFAQLRRPLDFTAVSDHSEWMGEIRNCLTLGSPGYNDPNCVAVRNEVASPPAGITAPLPLVVIAFQLTIQSATPTRLALCGVGGIDCLTTAGLVWQDELDAAEAHYDRTSACSFTTFPAYEWTNNLDGYNLHRNIIFRNAEVPALPTSYYEEPLVEGLFGALETECLDAPGNCDFVSIPHNSNASGGLMFEPSNGDGSPLTEADALRRSTHETLVEVFQHKGSSECHPLSSPNDEFCGFEQLGRLKLFENARSTAAPPALNFVRDALEEGIRQQDLIGVNPFKLGMIGGTDAHNSNPGATVEEDFAPTGHLGVRDGIPENMLSRTGPGGVTNNAGGLSVLWAEENSRDSLFAAMRRREAYATSGTRPIVRFFGGRLPEDICDNPAFAEEGYTHGVPMGGDVGPSLSKKSPRFAVMASQDPGGNGEPGTPLQRIQIVKGWVDSKGETREAVYDVAGDVDSNAGVDTTTCSPTGTDGHATLCAVWQDPKFKPNERAFYYARVLENPVCRWSTRLCNDLAVDCSDLPSVPDEYIECCRDLAVPTIQERAWTSPIFYQPEGFGVKARMRFGTAAGEDDLKLQLTIGRVSPDIDINTNDLEVAITDDDTIYSVTFPAGSFEEKKPGRSYSYKDSSGANAGVLAAALRISSKGTGKLKLKVKDVDLANADTSNHRVDVRVVTGAYDQTDSRYWGYESETLTALE